MDDTLIFSLKLHLFIFLPAGSQIFSLFSSLCNLPWLYYLLLFMLLMRAQLLNMYLTPTLFFHIPKHTSNCPLFTQDSKVTPPPRFLVLIPRTVNMMTEHAHDYRGGLHCWIKNRDLCPSISRNWRANVMRLGAQSSPMPPKNGVWPSPSLSFVKPTVDSPVQPRRLLTKGTGIWYVGIILSYRVSGNLLYNNRKLIQHIKFNTFYLRELSFFQNVFPITSLWILKISSPSSMVIETQTCLPPHM